MNKVRGRRALPLLALFASFCTGVLVDGWLRTYGPPKPAQATSEQVRASPSSVASDGVRLKRDTTGNSVSSAPPGPGASSSSSSSLPSSVVSGLSRATGSLPNPTLRVPIEGVNLESFKGGFSELRGSRPHEAVDILAPRGTPIHAVQDGTIAKLFLSKAGGTTIYQFDLGGRLCYYYAHLERYAEGLHEGQRISQGEVIGFVGTSGNAPPNTPHLHFAIFELNADRKWWQGRPLDPYLMFTEKG